MKQIFVTAVLSLVIHTFHQEDQEYAHPLYQSLAQIESYNNYPTQQQDYFTRQYSQQNTQPRMQQQYRQQPYQRPNVGNRQKNFPNELRRSNQFNDYDDKFPQFSDQLVGNRQKNFPNQLQRSNQVNDYEDEFPQFSDQLVGSRQKNFPNELRRSNQFNDFDDEFPQFSDQPRYYDNQEDENNYDSRDQRAERNYNSDQNSDDTVNQYYKFGGSQGFKDQPPYANMQAKQQGPYQGQPVLQSYQSSPSVKVPVTQGKEPSSKIFTVDDMNNYKPPQQNMMSYQPDQGQKAPQQQNIQRPPSKPLSQLPNQSQQKAATKLIQPERPIYQANQGQPSRQQPQYQY